MNKLTISICIPCIEIHVDFLKRCVESIYNQQFLPKEVIIAISNIENLQKVQKQIATELIKFTNKLSIIIDYSSKKRFAGENRNRAVELATGDIISFIDADDLMRSDRLYIISEVFEKYSDSLGVLHYFLENVFPEENSIKKFDETKVEKYLFSHLLHFGHASFRKSVFNEYKYSDSPRIQDLEFISSLLPKHLTNLYIYKEPLSYYISNDSTLYGQF